MTARENIPRQKRIRRRVDGLVLLDKPLGVSSNQALQQVKRLFNAEKAGHTGSLDPLATGMLPLCFGQATKLCGYLLESDKRYVARVRFGEKTATGDAEGEVIARSDGSALTRVALEAVIPRFLGEIEQVPPMYSALKREGRPLYELAREGVEVERAARKVTIYALHLAEFGDGCCEINVSCSKGTYIRTLVEDLAAAAGQQAHLAALRRTHVQPFDGHPMVTLEQLEAAQSHGPEALDACLLPPLIALQNWPQVSVDADRAHYLSRGQAVHVPGSGSGAVAVVDPENRLLAIGEADGTGMVAPRRWLGP